MSNFVYPHNDPSKVRNFILKTMYFHVFWVAESIGVVSFRLESDAKKFWAKTSNNSKNQWKGDLLLTSNGQNRWILLSVIYIFTYFESLSRMVPLVFDQLGDQPELYAQIIGKLEKSVRNTDTLLRSVIVIRKTSNFFSLSRICVYFEPLYPIALSDFV